MENRSIVKVLILSLVTFGIYGIIWFFKTTPELQSKGADIPTPWLQIIPIANIYFYYKYFLGAEHATGGAVNGLLYFVLAFFVSPIVSLLLAQNEYNKLGGGGAMPAAAGMPGAPAQAQPQQQMQQPAPTEQPAQQAPQPTAMPEAPAQPQQPAAPAQPAQGPTAPEAPQSNNQQPPLVQ